VGKHPPRAACFSLRERSEARTARRLLGSILLRVNNDNNAGNADSTKDPTPDADPLCLDCGYDLRGHDADPIRCPECGSENARADLAIAASLSGDDFKEFETGPTTAIACFLCMMGGVAFLFSGVLGYSAILLLPATAIWLVMVWKFGKKHGFKYGWADVLIWFHVTIVVIVVGIGAAVTLAESIVGTTRTGFRTPNGVLILQIASVFLLPVIFKRIPSTWNPYTIAKRKLTFLAKRSAVERKKHGA